MLVLDAEVHIHIFLNPVSVKWSNKKNENRQNTWWRKETEKKKFRKSKIVKDRAPKSKKTPTPPYPHPF